jgi:hypothetical protein
MATPCQKLAVDAGPGFCRHDEAAAYVRDTGSSTMRLLIPRANVWREDCRANEGVLWGEIIDRKKFLEKSLTFVEMVIIQPQASAKRGNVHLLEVARLIGQRETVCIGTYHAHMDFDPAGYRKRHR